MFGLYIFLYLLLKENGGISIKLFIPER